jgi:hypothetical protein
VKCDHCAGVGARVLELGHASICTACIGAALTEQCWACHQQLINGAAHAAAATAAMLLPVGARVEIRTTVGSRIGRLIGYFDDGRAEVHIDGQTFAVVRDAVSMAPAAAQIPVPAAVP